jgi:sulfite reductase (NADPH) flavoprotein alpha-component
MSNCSKSHPYHVSLKERYRLTGPDSSKKTYHVVLDIGDSGISYEAGDSLAVHPLNNADIVNKTLHALGATGNEQIEDMSLREFLTKKANLTTVTRRLVEAVGASSVDRSNYHVWDFLQEHLKTPLSPEIFCSLLQPLLPRLYSISSAQHVVGDEIHLTVAQVEYTSNGHPRQGVASTYLCQDLAIGETLAVYVQPSKHFKLPPPDVPIIMVGPGTGIAPFRAFMQHRASHNATHSWLFFGEWTRSHHFLYEDFWTELVDIGKLRLDTAFSRDQEDKIYVQHRLIEQGAEVWQWIQDGASLYVCGDASRMAKDVDEALHYIAQQHGGLNDDDAKAFVKELRTSQRYLRDIY